MSGRDVLRERGLANDPPASASAPFRFDPVTGEVVPVTPQDIPFGMPDDYAARLVALDYAARIADDDDAMDKVISSARKVLAFLTATEPGPPKEHIFTDE